MTYPTEPDNREAHRAEKLAEGRRTGESKARSFFSSINCFRGAHAGPYGCANDGSACLCECHDLTQGAEIPA